MTETTKGKQLPRGIRNNNPLNIRRSNTKWEGMREVTTDKAFCEFKTMAFGFRAAFRLLSTYWHRHGCRTISDIINRWAPASDGNNTHGYIMRVCEECGHKPDDELPAPDHDNCLKWCHIVLAMAAVENGGYEHLDLKHIRQGWAMAFGKHYERSEN